MSGFRLQRHSHAVRSYGKHATEGNFLTTHGMQTPQDISQSCAAEEVKQFTVLFCFFKVLGCCAAAQHTARLISASFP